MTKESVLASLEKEIIEKNEYTVAKFFKDKIGLLLTSISLLAAFLVYESKALSWWVSSVECRYWNIDERFIKEDSNASVKLGVFLFAILIALTSQLVLKRLFDIFFLNYCKLYPIKMEVSTLEKGKRKIAWNIRKQSIILKLIIFFESKENSKEKIEEVNSLKKTLELQKDQIRSFHKVVKIFKKTAAVFKRYYRRQLFLGLGIALASSLLLTISIGLDVGENGIKNMIISMIVLTISNIMSAIIGSWCDTRGRFVVIYNDYVKSTEHEFDEDFYENILYILQDRIEHIKEKGVKKLISDKVCKCILGFLLYSMLSIAILLPMLRVYNLSRIDSLYVITEDGKDYAVVINNRNEFIMEQCEIVGDIIRINTNEIYITNAPMKLNRVKFSKVEKY